ncbi:MAG: hypothetical protein ACFHVJ_14870 [Aestuariibacter sp.]
MTERLSLKEINTYKRRLNWGEIPPFFHMVSTSLSDIQGFNVHGFDNSFKRLTDRSNWNLRRLNGRVTMSGEIYVERQPEVAVQRRFVGKNYELHCYPLIHDEPLLLFKKNSAEIDFKVWDPSTMQCLLKLPDFTEFMQYAYTRGDEADKLLVEFASELLDNTLRDLNEEVKIISLKGSSIKSIIKRIQEEGFI